MMACSAWSRAPGLLVMLGHMSTMGAPDKVLRERGRSDFAGCFADTFVALRTVADGLRR